MTTTTGKQAAAAAKTLLAERIALVETLGAALDTHRRAEEAVTTARAAAATAAQQARDAYDAAKTGGWTAAELTKAGLRAPNPARPRTTKSTKPPHKITEAYVPADTADDVAGAARACSGSQLPAPLLIAPMVKLHSPSPPTSPPSRRSSSCSSALRGCDSPARRAASRAPTSRAPPPAHQPRHPGAITSAVTNSRFSTLCSLPAPLSASSAGVGFSARLHPGSRPCPARRSRASSALACASRLFGINVQLRCERRQFVFLVD